MGVAARLPGGVPLVGKERVVELVRAALVEDRVVVRHQVQTSAPASLIVTPSAPDPSEGSRSRSFHPLMTSPVMWS